MLLHALLSGLIFGLYFTLLGLGLNLVFGVMRIVNLAHGDVLMLGAFAASVLYATAGLHPLLSAAAVLAAFFLLGLPFYYLVVPASWPRATPRCCPSSCSSACPR